MIKAIILDMDGTIFDTEKLIVDTFVSVFHSFNADLDQQGEELLIGKTTKEICEFASERIGAENVKNAMLEFTNRYCSYIQEFGTPIKLGLHELFSFIKNNGLKVALATSATKEIVDFDFENSGINLDVFDAVCTLDDVSKGKPDGEIYELSCKRLGLEPSECLAIEDSYVGITSAKNAGLTTIKVKDLEQQDLLKDKLVDYKVYNLNEVISLIEFLNIELDENVITEEETYADYQMILKCSKKLFKYNKISNANTKKAEKHLKNIFGKVGEEPNVRRPFYCDKGFNIEVGDKFFTNEGVAILDEGKVVFGDNCRIGPGVKICNADHMIEPKERINYKMKCKTIYFGNNVWVGANATILSGVKIGDNAVVGAGAVVIKDVKPNTIVVGNPAKFLRFIL